MYRKTLRHTFFPNLALDIAALRSFAIGTDKLSDEELARIAEENVEQLIDRLERQQPRYRYEVVFDSNAGSPVNPILIRPDLICSVND